MSRTFSLFFCAILIVGLATCARRVEEKSEPTPVDVRFSDSSRFVNVRPTDVYISIPLNHLWYIHTNKYDSQGGQDKNLDGGPWDRVEVRFLLPKFEARSPANELTFNEPSGKNILSLTLMKPKVFDGDTRKAWEVFTRIRPVDADPEAIAELRKKNRSIEPARVIQRHDAIGLIEYDGEDYELGISFFKHESIVIRCWRRPLATIKDLCESSFDLPSGLLVNIEFPRARLSQWREIIQRAEAIANSYIWKKESSIWRSWFGALSG